MAGYAAIHVHKALHATEFFKILIQYLAPYPGRAMASTRGLAVAEPSAGRVAVEVIVTLNRFTELPTGTKHTNVTVGRRGFDVRSRVTINFLKDSHDLACRSWRLLASRLGGVPTTRRSHCIGRPDFADK